MAENEEGKEAATEGEKVESVSVEQFNELAEKVTSLASTAESTVQGISAITSTLSRMDERDTQASEREEKESEKKGTLSGRELEALPRDQWKEIIKDEIRREMISPITEKVDETDMSVQRERVGAQVLKASQEHEDFWDFTEEMKVEAKNNPTLPPEDLYQLAKVHNPDRVKQLADAKTEADKQKEKGYGGMRPGGSGSSTNEGHMSAKEAAEDAWNKTMGNVDPRIFQNANA